MKSILALIILRLIAFLPLSTARSIGRVVGIAMFSLRAKPNKIAKINLALCYPNQTQLQIDKLTKKRMIHLAQTLFETPRLWCKPADWLDKKIYAVEGANHLHQALQDDRGTILLIPHLGNWEVIGLWVAKQATMTSLYQPPKLANLDNWIKSSRQKTGANLVPTNMRGVAALLKALTRGETVAILPDQQPAKKSGDFAPLFGMQALTMTLTHNLLNRTSSQVIFCCALREKGGWKLHFVPADQAIYSSDQKTSLQAMNVGVESMVAMAPEQYQWEYKRFRTQPEGSVKIYPTGI